MAVKGFPVCLAAVEALAKRLAGDAFWLFWCETCGRRYYNRLFPE
jgi:hypothetical protein